MRISPTILAPRACCTADKAIRPRCSLPQSRSVGAMTRARSWHVVSTIWNTADAPPEFIRDLKPDVVISGNTPTEAQAAIVAVCKAGQSGFVHWLQDFYSIAVYTLLRKRLGNVGRIIGLYYRWLERYQLRNSDAVVIISEDFRALASVWAGSDAKVRTITNWAALEDIPVCAKDNNWSREHELHRDFAFVYSGTLALKHDPGLLIRLAQCCGPGASVVVVAQGAGMVQLEDAKAKHRLDSLRLLPLQPIARFPEVLAAGDVLVAVIEADAGTYSVPSKVQSYLCAGRSILLAAPSENLAARVVARENAGIVVAPDGSDFMAAAIRLRGDNELRAQQGANGRAYAERAFDMMKIVDAFEETLYAAIPRNRLTLSGKQAQTAYTVSNTTVPVTSDGTLTFVQQRRLGSVET